MLLVANETQALDDHGFQKSFFFRSFFNLVGERGKNEVGEHQTVKCRSERNRQSLQDRSEAGGGINLCGEHLNQTNCRSQHAVARRIPCSSFEDIYISQFSL